MEAPHSAAATSMRESFRGGWAIGGGGLGAGQVRTARGVVMARFIGKVGRRKGGWGVDGGSDEGSSRLVGGGVRGGGGNEEPPLRAREHLTVDHCEIPWVWRG